MVTLVKPFAGNPYWHKNVLKQLGIAERVRNLKNEKKKGFEITLISLRRIILI